MRIVLGYILSGAQLLITPLPELSWLVNKCASLRSTTLICTLIFSSRVYRKQEQLKFFYVMVQMHWNHQNKHRKSSNSWNSCLVALPSFYGLVLCYVSWLLASVLQVKMNQLKTRSVLEVFQIVHAWVTGDRGCYAATFSAMPEDAWYAIYCIVPPFLLILYVPYLLTLGGTVASTLLCPLLFLLPSHITLSSIYLILKKNSHNKVEVQKTWLIRFIITPDSWNCFRGTRS